MGQRQFAAAVTAFLDENKLPESVYVTRPAMPPLADYEALLEGIWERRWLTNLGELHERFESRLAAYLGVEHLTLTCNGTLALLVALRALGHKKGEIITTPFSFPATPHALEWLGFRPVFCDVDPGTLNLDPAGIEAAIGPETRAILPVHVYGLPCDVEAIGAIAERHGVPVLYDAAHAFGVRYRGQPIGQFGDFAVFSFHATKLFTTVEGGAVVCRSAEMKRRLDLLRNFGIAGEEEVELAGINGKMNELAAAFGLLQLDQVDDEIGARRRLVAQYRNTLHGIPGLSEPGLPEGAEPNGSYFIIRVDASAYGMDRDALHDALRWCNIVARKYFYPLCTHYPVYRDLPSAAPERLPHAEQAAREVLCLPLYGNLDPAVVQHIGHILRALHRLST